LSRSFTPVIAKQQDFKLKAWFAVRFPRGQEAFALIISHS
jgi:hypothetical protein